jgi:trimeric autotransporter adhesin
MRESSFLFSKQNSQQPKYQGGEKKVMKKSLSLILAIAMVFSMFASVAFAAEATTTTTPKTTEEKYEALKALGIFEGDDTGANLTGDMTRAQLAKIVAKLLKVEENKAANTYTDVPADHWAAGFIGAATEAKAFDGRAPGKFEPEGKVTYQELAAVLLRLTGLAQSTDAVTGKVDEWAKGYVATAVKELGLSQADYTVNSNRGVFVELTFAALPKVVVPGKVSVTEAKATGVQKVTVAFNKAVDDSKATLTLKKGTVDVAVTTKFAEDKKSAVLTLKDNAKIGDAEYTVTLAGLDADTVGTATAKFTATAETVKSIAFASTNDTIAQSTKARVKVEVKNQYDENVSLSAGNFTVVTSGFDSNITKDNTGALVVTIDTTTTIGSGANTTTPGLTMIPVYVYENESRISAQKTFKLGTPPFVTKVELAEAKYAEGKTALSATGDVATLAVTQYDQYSNPVAVDSAAISNINLNVLPYSDKIKAEYGDFDNDNYGEVRVSLTGRVETTGDYNVTIYAGSSTATSKISVKSTKLATKVGFGEFTKVLAEGDTIDAYVPIEAYDAEGTKLTADEIVDSQNLNRIKVTATNVSLVKGATDGPVEIQTTGEHKGKIHLNRVNGINGSQAYFTAYIATAGANSYANKSIKIEKVRTPDSFKVDTEALKSGVLGADDDFKIFVIDQYGEKIGTSGTYNENGKSVVYSVYVQATETQSVNSAGGLNPTYLSISGQGTNATKVGTLVGGGILNYANNEFATFNTGFNFVADNTNMGNGGKIEFKAVLRKNIDNEAAAGDFQGLKWRDVTSVSRSYVNASAANEFTYSASTVGNLFAAKDSGILTAAQKVAADATVAKKIAITAKDTAGNSVKLPDDRIVSVTSSTYDVAVADTVGTTGWVLGNKAGTATVNVIYKTIKGEQKQTSVDVTVKSEAVSVATLTADANKTSAAASTLTAATLMNLKAVDNYGIEYKDAKVANFYNLIGISFVLEDATGSARVDATTGVVTGAAVGETFTLKAYSANGKSVTTFVTLN